MTLDRQLAIYFGALSALAAAVALFGLYHWGRWMRYGTWRDASSPTIDLVAAPQGAWEHRWGATSSRERVRGFAFRAPDGSRPNWPSTLCVDVRITPSRALEPASAARTDADGWLTCSPVHGEWASLGFDPSQVERIEWRATPGSTPSAGATPPFVLFVPGLADSEEPHGWLIDAAMTIVGAAAALVLAWVARCKLLWHRTTALQQFVPPEAASIGPPAASRRAARIARAARNRPACAIRYVEGRASRSPT